MQVSLKAQISLKEGALSKNAIQSTVATKRMVSITIYFRVLMCLVIPTP